MSGKDWREAKEYRKRMRDMMIECPRCSWLYASDGRNAPRYYVGEKCRTCSEVVE